MKFNMELTTAKTHSELDWNSVKKAFSDVNEELCGEQITSPFDLYSVEQLRDKHKLRKGNGVLSDAFVLGRGKSTKREVTKVSGLPFFPKAREWPNTPEGEPYQFLAQFNFADSRDIVANVPGDILLLFVPQDDEDWLWETAKVRCEWVKLSEGEPIEKLPSNVKPFCESEWYGVIHRTKDYPESQDAADELEVDQAYNLPILNGTKIGGIPHGIQSAPDLAVDPKTGFPVAQVETEDGFRGRFLCQITSIQAAPDVPFPWTNQKAPLSLDFNEKGIYGESNQCVFGDMGTLYVFMNDAGECIASFECY